VKDLASRLAALDPDASAALRIIAHFDHLVTARASLSTIVREVGALTGCAARLLDADRRLTVRVEPDGAAQPPSGAVDPGWLSAPLPGEGTARIWLERRGPAGPVEAMVLERAAVAAAAVLRHTRSVSSRAQPEDPAWVDLLLDAAVPEPDRLRAARRCGLVPTGLVRAVAVAGGPPEVEQVPSPAPPAYQARRAGVGTAGAVLDLPSSWAAARTALRFTAEGTHADPGPRIVRYEDLGSLAVLASAVTHDTDPVPDVVALTTVAATAPWALATLTAVAGTGSLRTAAAELRIHHSTLRDRLCVIEPQLGWPVRDQPGRLRLHLALTLRRLHRNPA
jgi:hypothetical protein